MMIESMPDEEYAPEEVNPSPERAKSALRGII
jgi:hypothetical protein